MKLLGHALPRLTATTSHVLVLAAHGPELKLGPPSTQPPPSRRWSNYQIIVRERRSGNKSLERSDVDQHGSGL